MSVQKGFLRAPSEAAQSLRQGSRGKCDWEPAGGENEWRLSGLGGVLLEADGEPDALKVLPTSIWVPSNEYYHPSFPLIGRRGNAQPGLEPRSPRWAP